MTNEELKALAEAATPGPWEHRFVEGDGTSGAICHEHGWVADDFTDQSFKDTAYMAAANPAAVLGLIADNEKLLKLLTRMVDQHVPLTELEGVPGWSRVVELVEVVAERDALKAECEGLRKDAERYRWLRNGVPQGKVDICIVRCDWTNSSKRVLEEESADFAVDVAMSEVASNG